MNLTPPGQPAARGIVSVHPPIARVGDSLRLQPGGWQDRKVPDHAQTPPLEPPSDQVATKQQLRAAVHAWMDAVAGEWQRLADATGAAPFSSGRGGSRPGGRRSAPGGPRSSPSAARRRPDPPAPAAGTGPVGQQLPQPAVRHGRRRREAAATLAATLFERRPFEVSLGFVDAAAPELDLYRAAAAAAGCRMLERTMQRSPYVITTRTRGDFARERLSRNRRSQLGRARRRLEREGPAGCASRPSPPRPGGCCPGAVQLRPAGRRPVAPSPWLRRIAGRVPNR
jgi:hypothetical protein